MTKKAVIASFISFFAIVIVIVSVTFAWYTNTNRTGSVSYDSNGVMVSYELTKITNKTDENGAIVDYESLVKDANGNSVNLATFDVEDLAFFDINNGYEGYYFTPMAVRYKLNVKNYSSKAVSLNVKVDASSYTLGTSIKDGVITVYSYTATTTVTRATDFSTTEVYYFDATNTYVQADEYLEQTTYYTKATLATVTPTVASSKVTAVSAKDASDNALLAKLDSDGAGIIVEKYAAVSDLTQAGFNSGIYYTYDSTKKIYSISKEFDGSASYFQLQTVAYLGGITVGASAITAVGKAVTGSYVTCAISSSKLTSTTTVSSTNIKTTSVNKYLTDLTVSDSFTTASNLAKSSALNTAGGEQNLYLYFYGVQPYDGATNNFLNNATNTYPVTIIIKAQ